MPLPNDIKEKLNQANPNTLPDAMRELKMGTYLEELEAASGGGTTGPIAAADVMVAAGAGGNPPEATTAQAVIEGISEWANQHMTEPSNQHTAAQIGVADVADLWKENPETNQKDVEHVLYQAGAYFSIIQMMVGGLYPIEFVGGSAAGLLDISAKKADAIPAEGHQVLFILGRVTADGAMIATPVIDTDFAAELEEDSGTVKIRQLSESDLSANTYVAFVLPVPDMG